jgi:yecA family protein
MNYQQLNERGRSIGLEVDAAESHGILCGLLCGGDKDPEGVWLGELLAGQDSRDLLVVDCAEGLRNLARETWEAIEGPGLGFSPVLPDDSQALSVRAIALRDWCRGFLYGMGLSGTGEDQLSAETLEAVSDMIGISRLDTELVSSSEQDEEAYTELCEFVWVAAMLVYEEWANKEDG